MQVIFGAAAWLIKVNGYLLWENTYEYFLFSSPERSSGRAIVLPRASALALALA